MKKKVTAFATVAILSSAFASSAFADNNTYTVKKGDTLSHIARSYSTSVNKLKSLNGLTSDLITVNQKLAVAKQTEAPAPTNTVPEDKSNLTYTIVKGDTLGAISLKHNISLADLKTWNKLTSDMIFPGQKLTVSNSAAPAPAPTPVATQPSGNAPAPAAPITADYKIKSGDTLSKIATLHNISVPQLKALNNLSSDTIYAGKTLKVSSGQASSTEPVVNTPVPSTNDQKVVSEAKAMIGTPYSWGGSNPGGFDCSGLIYYAFKQAGQPVTRTSAEGYYSRSYYINEPQPGDLVFFENTYKKGISHMGIYLGNNEFIHAGNSGVEITNLNNSYYKKHFEGFKRFY